jgi:hypothetical protein
MAATMAMPGLASSNFTMLHRVTWALGLNIQALERVETVAVCIHAATLNMSGRMTGGWCLLCWARSLAGSSGLAELF